MSIRILKLPFVILPLVFLTLSACKSKDPNPELKDPIYSDLQREYSNHQKILEEAKKLLAKAESELATEPPRSLDKKIKQGEVSKAQKAVRLADQMTQYYKIRADLRRVYARRDYKIAFDKGEPWPDPKEFEAYKTNKRLRDVPLNWSAHLPKNGAHAVPTEAKTGEAGGEGEGAPAHH